nr:hypothetical protein [Geothrix sp. 21YS21S-2]
MKVQETIQFGIEKVRLIHMHPMAAIPHQDCFDAGGLGMDGYQALLFKKARMEVQLGTLVGPQRGAGIEVQQAQDGACKMGPGRCLQLGKHLFLDLQPRPLQARLHGLASEGIESLRGKPVGQGFQVSFGIVAGVTTVVHKDESEQALGEQARAGCHHITSQTVANEDKTPEGKGVRHGGHILGEASDGKVPIPGRL